MNIIGNIILTITFGVFLSFFGIGLFAILFADLFPDKMTFSPEFVLGLYVMNLILCLCVAGKIVFDTFGVTNKPWNTPKLKCRNHKGGE